MKIKFSIWLNLQKKVCEWLMINDLNDLNDVSTALTDTEN